MALDCVARTRSAVDIAAANRNAVPMSRRGVLRCAIWSPLGGMIGRAVFSVAPVSGTRGGTRAESRASMPRCSGILAIDRDTNFPKRGRISGELGTPAGHVVQLEKVRD